MCLTILLLERDGPWAARLVSFREEFLDRSWVSPHGWWAHAPSVVGGRDEQGGGTWLAVDTARSTVAAIHTSFVERVPAERRQSRGLLPVLAASGQDWRARRLDCFDDFAMLVAGQEGGEWHEYREGELTSRAVPHGLHLASVAGLGPDTPRVRHQHWTPVLEQHGLPALDAGGSPAADWTSWLERIGADSREPTDELALLIRREVRDRVFGTSCVSSVAVPSVGSGRGMAFHLLPRPGAEWQTVLSSRPPATHAR